MSLQTFYKTTVDVKRLTAGFGGDPDKSDYQTVATFKGNVQQATPEATALVDGVFGRTYTLFCDRSADILETDTLIIATVEYRVKGILDLDEGGIGHKEVTIIKDIS